MLIVSIRSISIPFKTNYTNNTETFIKYYFQGNIFYYFQSHKSCIIFYNV